MALDYRLADFGARVEGIFAGEQERVADNELPTDGYFMLNAVLSRRFLADGIPTDLYVKGVNLTNEEAREHTSFLKDIAPLPGRGIVVGAKVTF
jgi:iron complex outermembrane receptor protein